MTCFAFLSLSRAHELSSTLGVNAHHLLLAFRMIQEAALQLISFSKFVDRGIENRKGKRKTATVQM